MAWQATPARTFIYRRGWTLCNRGKSIERVLANGTRLIVTLLHALEAQNLKRGVAALCIGGGEATAIAIERVVRR